MKDVDVTMRRFNTYQLESKGDEVIFTKIPAWNISEPKKDLSPHIRVAQGG